MQSNKIHTNERCGLYLLSETAAKIENNQVSHNKLYGVDIQDPSKPELRNNTIQDNEIQVKLDKDIKKRWEEYKSKNTINRPNELPQGLGCSIF